MSNSHGQSWTDTFFSEWPLPDWINEGREDKKDFRLFDPQKKWILGGSADTGRYSEFGRIQVLWLIVRHGGIYYRQHVAKIFPEYTERDAEMQLRRLPSRIPKTVKEVRDELDWFPNELRVFHRIDASCTSSQRIYFPEFHGVIKDLKKYLGSPYAKHRAIALECIRPKLSSRRILAAHKEHSHGDKFKDKLSGLGSLSDFEVDYYDSLFTDRIRRLLTLHRLGITHGDIKDEHFRLPMDFFDTALYDFSHSYTFSPVKPYLLSFSLPRPLKNISRAEKLDLREHLVETIGATQSVIMDALIQPLQEELSIEYEPDYLHSLLHAVGKFGLPFSRGYPSGKDKNGNTAIEFVTDQSHPENSGEERIKYLLCLIPKTWEAQHIHSQLINLCSSFSSADNGCIKTWDDIMQHTRELGRVSDYSERRIQSGVILDGNVTDRVPVSSTPINELLKSLVFSQVTGPQCRKRLFFDPVRRAQFNGIGFWDRVKVQPPCKKPRAIFGDPRDARLTLGSALDRLVVAVFNRGESASVPANKPVQLLFPPQSRIVTTNDPVGLFLDQYVVCSRDSRVSRGFLDGLPSLLASGHPSSDLVRAVEIVAWATLGNKISRPDLLARARRQYTGLLCSFQDLLHCCQLRAPTVESLVIAILLGLYEIVSSDEITQEQQKHVAHVRGVCALLLSPNSPFDLLSSTQLFQVANPLLIKRDLQVQDNRGVLCAPASNHAVHNLDSILIKCHPLFEHANTQLQDPLASFYELQITLDRALAIELAFSQWGPTQDVSWKADIVGFMSQQDAEASSCPFAWGGPVHAYFDIYVAAVMNTYRKTYLMLLDVLIRLASRMGGTIRTDNVTRWEKQAHILIYDIVASIPYHLANNLHAYQQDILSLNSPPGLGRSVGGLLLLHPLFVLSTCSAVPRPIQNHALKCLAWIGQHMGIGQGMLMSKGYSNLPFQETAEGHVLIWAGMLLHPAEKRTQL
ncbi:hypothetical protein AnigIFM63604_007374 [Aspergillus niger]|uniref:Protein kinase domain-containing protein n=1 Tax=Aspergillus niger TaxID=5061 RepID=A0A9W6A0J8_ASPNG|nr:hypothetical protein AnigIFM63604_007374 [Aspergillus niger]